MGRRYYVMPSRSSSVWSPRHERRIRTERSRCTHATSEADAIRFVREALEAHGDVSDFEAERLGEGA
jgi:hypothetical protein